MTQAQPKYKPFDLEAAKAGAALITRDGRPAKFVGHVPECPGKYRVLAFATGRENVDTFTESGALVDGDSENLDLFMAPVKRMVWVNVYRDRGELSFGSPHDSEAVAKRQPGTSASSYLGTFALEFTE